MCRPRNSAAQYHYVRREIDKEPLQRDSECLAEFFEDLDRQWLAPYRVVRDRSYLALLPFALFVCALQGAGRNLVFNDAALIGHVPYLSARRHTFPLCDNFAVNCESGTNPCT